ncbi:MAG: GNAT family N-acetyltransferase [Paludibacteraceae bacterium]|nr:GNAT family N-acetyltransferase [Paludibacteraceae bacterium]
MTKKELYRNFCKLAHQLPIFMHDWWLDAVCAGKHWDALLCVKTTDGYCLSDGVDKEEDIVAVLPYLHRERMWMRYVIMPQMTQMGGIWIHECVRDDEHAVKQICALFCEALQTLRLSYYYQHFPLYSTAPQRMQEFGFKLKKRVTYRIEDLSDLDRVINGFSKNKKRQLQKALSLHVDYSMNIEDFYRFHQDCLRQQGKAISYTREFLLVLDRKTKRLNQGQVLAIRNADERLLAAAFLVWDKQSMYYLIPCYSPLYKDSGASALLVLEAIKLARKLGVAFDFEGSMIKGVAQHYKQFGSSPVTYYSVEKYYNWWFWFANIYNKLRQKGMR